MAQERHPFSARLQELMADVLAGRAPNVGRFCGACFHPLRPQQRSCPHCGASTHQVAPVEHIPWEVISMFQAQRLREALAVRGLAYGGLVAGVVLALLPIVLWDVRWWTVLLLFAILGVAYVGAANLANTLGDALGYRWGQAVLRRRWERFTARRQ
jgi:hypothetical protein